MKPTCILILSLLFSLSIEAQPKSQQFKPPNVVNIDTSRLVKITPGQNGVRLPKVVKAGKPNDMPNRLRSIPAGKPEVFKIDRSKLKKFTQGKNGIPIPKKYIIPESGYLVQHGDTIWAPKTVTVRYPKPEEALPLRIRDNAVYNLQYLDMNQGLPSSFIRAICQDSVGNLWFGSDGGGLSRYDGNTFTSFTKDEGLNHNMVMSVISDASGAIWVATYGGGVSRFDGTSFTTYTTDQGLVNDNVWTMATDQNGNIWFGTIGGVSRFDGTAFISITEGEGLINNNVWSIVPDQTGNLWFGTNRGLCRYDGTTLTYYTNENGLANNFVRSVFEDSQGIIWIGTWGGGVSRFNGSSFTSFSTKDGLNSNYVLAILEDGGGNLWFGTENHGASRYDGNSFTSFTEKEGLSNNSIWAMIEDASDNIWFATIGGGVSRYHRNSFTTFTETEGLSNKFVFSIIEDRNKNLWLANYSGGITCFDGHSFKSYTEKEGLSSNYVWTIHEDQRGHLWVGTQGNGVFRYDGSTFTTFNIDEGMNHRDVRAIIEDQHGNLWFGTYGGGVSRFDGTSFTPFTVNEGLSENRVTAMIEDSRGHIWIGTFGGGLNRYDGNRLISYTKDTGLANDNVLSLYEDTDGNLWISTGGGIAVIDKENLEHIDRIDFKTYTTKDGLPHNYVASFCQDNLGRMWLGTTGGIMLLYDPSKWNWETGDYRVFKQEDGLKRLDFFNSVCLDSKNHIWWGMGKGLTRLDLSTFELADGIPEIQLNSIDINGVHVDYHLLKQRLAIGGGFSIGKDEPSSLSDVEFSSVIPFYNYPEKLSLPADLNHLSFNFSAIAWESPHKIQFQYMIEGLDKDWSDLNWERKAEYRNLPNGEFVFKVKAIGAANRWSDTLAYPFSVRPPWWFTSWAKVLWVGLFLSLLFAVYKMRTNALKIQQRRLQEKVEEQTKALKQSYIQLAELDNYKDSMNSMIIHDFKNSLNTVINFSEEAPTKRRLQSINQAGKFMLNMVLNMLDVQKFETTKVKLSKADYPVGQIIILAIEQLSHLIDQKSIQVNYSQEKELISRMDQELILRCVVNILSNAIKFEPANGQIDIIVEQLGQNINISIKDNGPGIPADKLEKVFDKFSQIHEKKSGSVRSTGIGLTFCKMVVEAHDGIIRVESTEGHGSKFYFTLPLIFVDEGSKPEKTPVQPEQDLVLSDDDKAVLGSYIEELKKWEVFDYSEVMAILERVEPDGENINAWKEAMVKALQNGNEEQFKQLVMMNEVQS